MSPSHMAPRTLRAQIESLWASGKSDRTISALLDADFNYVREVISRFASRPTPECDDEDHGKHLRLIFLANKGMGFPYCVPPVARRAA